MSLRKLVDNGIDIEFEIENKKYTISRDFEKQVYSIYSCTRYKYIGHTEYETEDSDIYLEYKEWEDIEKFIERLVEEVEDER